jgi:hypothetical protein
VRTDFPGGQYEQKPAQNFQGGAYVKAHLDYRFFEWGN